MEQSVPLPVRLRLCLSACMVAALLGACAAPSKPVTKAPVVDRTAKADVPAAVPTVSAAPLPGAENAGKPGYYTVRTGDTLTRIGLDTGQSWRDLAAWNGLTNPNLIEVGQVLRVVPPTSTAPPANAGVASAAPVAEAGAPATSAVSSPTAQARPLASPAKPAAASANSAAPAPDEIRFVWPAAGAVVDPFDESRNKGIGIGGRPGEPVQAAADGRVVYAGAGLRGYGNLVILKHNNTYLTAYAHNQAILVREDQTVKQGQKIAEMGSSDADRVKLHFEVRRQGKPVDPLKHLPQR